MSRVHYVKMAEPKNILWTPEMRQSLVDFRFNPDGTRTKWRDVAIKMKQKYPNEPFTDNICSSNFNALPANKKIPTYLLIQDDDEGNAISFY